MWWAGYSPPHGPACRTSLVGRRLRIFIVFKSPESDSSLWADQRWRAASWSHRTFFTHARKHTCRCWVPVRQDESKLWTIDADDNSTLMVIFGNIALINLKYIQPTFLQYINKLCTPGDFSLVVLCELILFFRQLLKAAPKTCLNI